MSMLRSERLSVSIGSTRVCHELDLHMDKGQSWAVLGPNGSGKTTLIHTLAGLRLPQQGQVILNNKDIKQYSARAKARQAGVLFQQETDYFPSTVLEYVLMGRHPHLEWWQWESRQDIDIAKQALKQVDLDGLQERDINSLSGGERRRMNIACLLCQDPDIAMLDEPGNHLDLQHQIETLGLIREQYQDRLMIMSAHDINLCMRYCTHALLLLGDGKTEQGDISTVMTTEKLEQVYGLPLTRIEHKKQVLFFPT